MPPTAAPTRTIASLSATGGVYHEVRAGENLYRIAKIYGVEVSDLLDANRLPASCEISAGQKLFVPGKSAPRKREPVFIPSSSDSFSWPIRGTLVSGFGMKLDRSKNKGIDILADDGADVRASRSGKIVFCEDQMKGFGKTVIIDHGDRFQTVYAYNSANLVRLGDYVAQNTVIARAGSTGRAKAPSLHFEIRKDGKPQNPLCYLPR